MPQIDILNCAAGHAEVKIDTSDPINLERSKRIIEDMLRRGYVLFVTSEDNTLTRIEAFDPKREVYIIGDGPLYAGGAAPAEAEEEEPRNPLCGEVQTAGATAKRGPGRPRGTYQKREVPMASVNVTAVPRTAGG